MDQADYESLVKNGTVLTEDSYGVKVIRLSDGCIAKLFRRKRIISSAILWPYAKRFVRAVELLGKMGVPTVRIKNTYKVPSIKRYLIIYKPLRGISLRDKLITERENLFCLLDFAKFFAFLHNNGIYFRAVHFNNVFVLEDNRFGLIDVDSLHFFSSSPLLFSKRIRNFKPILHHKQDRQAIREIGIECFLDHYLEKAEFRFKSDPENLKKKVIKLCSSMSDKAV